MWLCTVLVYFLQIALRVSDDTLIHHQEHIQTVITTSGTGRTVEESERSSDSSTVRPVPDVVITVWMCSWWWMRVSSETRRAICRKYTKTVHSHILTIIDTYYTCFFRHAECNSLNNYGKERRSKCTIDRYEHRVLWSIQFYFIFFFHIPVFHINKP